ncbi:hypothetical protein [Streptomyces sp. UNOC14_S4]|uniref:hypothetical protein n=1 Tax=Streptomyces sp. UNOC14_S4 TaxID=2872340 RepID=UPI001E3B7391|nr:hypothetical protein [Streptomyces sp. UNOC14_S4]MCC3765995.1 hypothetical protein [Streptomyces sp. UNOC14_S4]
MTGHNAFYKNLAEAVHDIDKPETGQSGYFSKPATHLDPNLFDGDRVKPELRSWIIDILEDFFRDVTRFRLWAEVWIAGSGISYQWEADRGNGDLDVLIGVDYSKFTRVNPVYAGLASAETAQLINDSLRRELWPQTANTRIGDKSYEVTFYWNSARGVQDITAIHPYAAYSLTKDAWTVRPPDLAEDPRSLYPSEYTEAADIDEQEARYIIDRYRSLQGQLSSLTKASPAWMNAAAELKRTVAVAAQLYNSIHDGRQQAFTLNGDGYSDFHNFRWQSAKERGIAASLREIKNIGVTAQELTDTELYGEPIADARQALISAALWGKR